VWIIYVITDTDALAWVAFVILLPAALRGVRPAVDQTDAQHGAAALQGGVGERCPVVSVEAEGQAPPCDGLPQHVLAGPGVLLGHPAPVHQQA